MSRRADVRNRLHAEIDALLARNPTPGYSEMEDLPYMKNFTREILRLYSPGKLKRVDASSISSSTGSSPQPSTRPAKPSRTSLSRVYAYPRGPTS